jgi:hypothetical protein
MKYLDNLIDWGDKLFRRDTIESINEATQCYVLAARILGARAERGSPPAVPDPEILTYASLRPKLDAFSNPEVENLIVNPLYSVQPNGSGKNNGASSLFGLASLAFCIPPNDHLLAYWARVEDRLFKIRNCMNIEGVVRELALFEPPIDPALLVRARAMGLDLSSVLDDLYAPLPHYRFTFMLQKAREFCEDLKQLGNLLLSVLEKRDAEKLAQIRTTHEKDLLKAILEVRKKQVTEAEETKASLEKARLETEERRNFYKNISKRIPEEEEYLNELGEAQDWQERSHWADVAAAAGAMAPDITVATAGMASGVHVEFGGTNLVALAQATSRGSSAFASKASYAANVASIKGGWNRRQAEWDLQARLAQKNLDQIDKQIAAAEIRAEIAEKERANHEKQIEHAETVEAFLREKFTNQELYNWMVSQVSAVYFQTYKLAYDQCKRLERGYRHELGIADSGFVQFGAWDNLRKGLLAGERLSLDLRRLEAAYLEGNKREHEVTKHVSLALLDPVALLKLRETGTCEFSMPELLFDLDFPGHYYRRIKSVRLSIPCITGPYTSVNAKLTLLHNRTRKTAKDTDSEKYPYDVENTDGDDRFLENLVGIQSIATSSGQNDGGLFELNFRDERFLPFEGAGVISRWRLDMPTAYRHFDYDTISDVILHVSYTARDGGDALKEVVRDHVKATINNWLNELAASATGLPRLFSLRQEFPDAFHRFLNPSPGSPQFADFEVTSQHFPYFLSEKNLQLTSVTVYLKPKTKDSPIDPSEFELNDVPPTEDKWNPHFEDNLRAGEFTLTESPIKKWTIKAASPGLDKEQLEDILLLLMYKVT